MPKGEVPSVPKDHTAAQEKSQLITGKKDLLQYFQDGCKKPDQLFVGMEVEKFAVDRTTGNVVSYFAKNGPRAIQEKLVTEQGWEIEKKEGKFLLTLRRGETRITFEHDGTLEFSGRTHVTIHDLAREFRLHQQEVAEISKALNVVWLGIGYMPFPAPVTIRRVLPPRYDTLQAYLRRHEKDALLWQRNCATIQANFDYLSEEDAMKKLQLMLRLTPIITAIFANSPFADGKLTKYVSYRRHLITELPYQRYRLPDHFFSKSSSIGFQDWIDFYLEVPMLAVVRDGVWHPVSGLTFAQFLKEGYKGYAPTIDDWILHLSFVYTDVRIRNYIESRACDAVPPFLAPAFQALLRTLLYSKKGPELIMELTKDWKPKDFQMLNAAVAQDGLHTKINGKRVLDYARELLNIASDHLKEDAHLNEDGKDETMYLEPMKDFVFVKEKSPGRYIAEQWEGEWHRDPKRLIEWCAY